MPSKEGSTLVVGAGVFGLTLARELCRRGYSDVTVLDRYPPPVPDGSSVDISRIIRSDYADAEYSKMGSQAIAAWGSEYSQHYHEGGLLLLADEKGHPYVDKSKEQIQSQGGEINVLEDSLAVRAAHPEFARGDLKGCQGYSNPRAGWADAAGAIRQLADMCAASGVSFVTGARGTVRSIVVEDGGRVAGVEVKKGPPILADLVILATGAWTPRLVDLTQRAVSTGQPVGFTQLSDEEADELRRMPIALNLDSGFFVFPPTAGSNILKCARHGFGYETRVSTTDTSGKQRQVVSTPKVDSDGVVSSFLPEDAEHSLREGLRRFFPPSISERPFAKKRLCWYTDTPQGDFIVDYHPAFRNLFLATGGSGHAFKFLPILGAYTCDAVEGKLSGSLKAKWAWKDGDEKSLMHGDGSRGGPARRCLEDWEQSALFGTKSRL